MNYVEDVINKELEKVRRAVEKDRAVFQKAIAELQKENERLHLEASGAIFLTDDEKKALTRFMHYQPLAGPDDSAEEWKRQWDLIESIREKLS